MALVVVQAYMPAFPYCSEVSPPQNCVSLERRHREVKANPWSSVRFVGPWRPFAELTMHNTSYASHWCGVYRCRV